MKRLLLLILVGILCLAAAGCGTKEPAWVQHTYQDLTISLPENFIDLSREDFAAGMDFLQGLDPIAVNGLREEKSLLAQYGLEPDLQTYAQLVISANELTVSLEEQDNIPYFTYEATAEGVSYTYVVTLWETQEAFWSVQSYCPTADYPAAKDTMWTILKSVKV